MHASPEVGHAQRCLGQDFALYSHIKLVDAGRLQTEWDGIDSRSPAESWKAPSEQGHGPAAKQFAGTRRVRFRAGLVKRIGGHSVANALRRRRRINKAITAAQAGLIV